MRSLVAIKEPRIIRPTPTAGVIAFSLRGTNLMAREGIRPTPTKVVRKPITVDSEKTNAI